MLPESKYLEFTIFPGLKTEIVDVRTKRDGYVLGRIKWFSRWRQYCFFPRDDSVFNPNCLIDIINCIGALKTRRLTKKGK
jgi:hypothetical protein